MVIIDDHTAFSIIHDSVCLKRNRKHITKSFCEQWHCGDGQRSGSSPWKRNKSKHFKVNGRVQQNGFHVKGRLTGDLTRVNLCNQSQLGHFHLGLRAGGAPREQCLLIPSNFISCDKLISVFIRGNLSYDQASIFKRTYNGCMSIKTTSWSNRR